MCKLQKPFGVKQGWKGWKVIWSCLLISNLKGSPLKNKSCYSQARQYWKLVFTAKTTKKISELVKVYKNQTMLRFLLWKRVPYFCIDLLILSLNKQDINFCGLNMPRFLISSHSRCIKYPTTEFSHTKEDSLMASLSWELFYSPLLLMC